MTFHPLNAMVGVPARDILLTPEAAGLRLEPVQIGLIPRFGARLEGVPSGLPSTGVTALTGESQPLLGGTIIATFSADALNRTEVYVLVVSENDRALARTRVDLGTVR